MRRGSIVILIVLCAFVALRLAAGHKENLRIERARAKDGSVSMRPREPGRAPPKGALETGEAPQLIYRARPVRKQVVDDFGEPLPEATAELVQLDESTRRVHADARGWIRITDDPWWTVSAPGRVSETPRTAQRIVLRERFSISGRVVDSSDDPVAGATVGCVQLARGPGTRKPPLPSFGPTTLAWPDTATSADGCFALDELVAGRLQLQISKPGYASTSVDRWAGEHGFDVQLFRACSVRVHLLRPDGRAAEGVDVSCDSDTKPGPVALFQKLTPGEHDLWTRDGERRASAHIELNEGEHRDVRLILRERPVRSSIEVLVLEPDGRPVPDATLRVFPKSFRTDGRGRATLRLKARPGATVLVEVNVPESVIEFVVGMTVRMRTNPPKEGRQPVVVRLRKAASIELKVLDREGEPVALRNIRWNTDYIASVGPGRWMVAEDAELTVELEPRDESLAERVVSGLRPGHHRIVMHPPPSVVFRVLDESKRPLNAGEFRVWIDVAIPIPAIEKHPTQPGRFRVPASSFYRFGRISRTVHFARGDVPEAGVDFDVQPGRDNDLGDVVLRKPIRIEGRVADRYGIALSGARIYVPEKQVTVSWDETSSRADGSFAMLVSADVRYLIVASPGHGTLLAPIGELDDVRLPAPGVLHIEGDERPYLGWERDGVRVWWGWALRERVELGPGRYVLGSGARGEHEVSHRVTIVEGQTLKIGAK